MAAQKKLTSLSCLEFSAALASHAPVPGGGGAAALTGALGAALCSMVCSFTVGKKKYAAVEEDIRAILERATVLRNRLEELVEQDAEAFEPLSKAYAIPKDEPGREAILEKATLAACKAPVEMVRCCAQVLDLLEETRVKGSVMLISDVGCGALLCEAAMKAAAMNVWINTRSLKDRDEAERIEAETEDLLKRCLPLAEQIASSVLTKIRE